MEVLQQRQTSACNACKDGHSEPFPFTMAFQPIVNVETGRVYAYEALARGPEQQSAGFVLNQVNDENLYAFDQACRVKAITLAAQLGLAETGAMLSINFLPGAVYSPAACIQLTLKTARAVGFPLDRLIFEIVEVEKVASSQHLMDIINEYRRCGFRLALDDFGAGWAGLGLLADVQADAVKLDIDLIRGIHKRPRALAIVESMALLSESLHFNVVAEGVETFDEYHALRDCGIKLMQGYLFARPGFESLPAVTLPEHR
ncbi:EAL domain-containing protein (putative c-di-GMP-specific phosphodiesterase class I) [Granulicella aggregans]|jgi:EAL domain-containing protein (putative c-di-GMP-specific phosphodiesterase class I)|uniref:EAL domain-containing protein (Putative c-di-GMP-specific phosphodiesterase class I) n=1 Tax=Granulicella aggregans TaxID=474949 RepID=A0A7W8E2Y7_9BACT|nr:EAL domain-containing protein [Granulicella aggregans]MBB5056674.1 EAL domain-containing protein (putative c-di-GMP-specific phosphodiesterase class I) [Granulicella aggregans]